MIYTLTNDDALDLWFATAIAADYLAHRRHGLSASTQASGDHGQRMSAADQTNGRPADEDFIIGL